MTQNSPQTFATTKEIRVNEVRNLDVRVAVQILRNGHADRQVVVNDLMRRSVRYQAQLSGVTL